jgi:hypothetical protein
MHAWISFVKNHPAIGGVFFAVFGVFIVYVSIDGAIRSHGLLVRRPISRADRHPDRTEGGG